MERVIWLASQANKTNMKNFFDILWCLRYGVIGNEQLRGVNPLACSRCKLNSTCVGLAQIRLQKVYLTSTINPDGFDTLSSSITNQISFICFLEENVPKKVFTRLNGVSWTLIDEFSGYLMTSDNALSKELVEKENISVDEFITSL